MGLSSLIKVAQGKHAGSVAFEEEFLKRYEEAVKRQEEAERQPVPTEYTVHHLCMDVRGCCFL